MDTKITVMGLGGVGGYLAAMLAKKWPENVSCIARGKRMESIREKGLVVHSERNGEMVAHPAKVTDKVEELGVQDIIFVCVKNYSLEDACRQIAPIVGENTVVVPVMNGVDPGDRTREYLGKGRVVDSVIYIISGANEDFSVTQTGSYAYIFFGVNNADPRQKEAIDLVEEIFTGAEVDGRRVEDIEAAIWTKYVFNCAYNVITTRYMATTGQLRADPVKTGEMRALLEEAIAVGVKAGVNFPEGLLEDRMDHFLNHQPAGGTSSMRRDKDAGKPLELETFSGYICRRAAALGVDAPVSNRFYQALKAL